LDDAGLQIGREGPSDDPARPGVENDREVEKASQRRQEGDVSHPQRVHAGGQLGVSHFKECGSNGPGD
jgi:hypothetical protein